MTITTTTKFETVEDALAAYANGGRSAVVAQARTEQKAVKAARDAKASPPATPAMEAIEQAHAQAIRPGKASSSTPRAPKVAVTFYRDGKPMPASQNSLSSLAWYGTRNIGGEGVRRISTGALLKILTDLAGGKDPRTTSWDAKLPNGTLMAARVEGDTTAVVQPTDPGLAKARAARSAGAAKKAPARKATAAKKAAPAKKAAATRGRQVTPRPKKATAKKA